ncbi:hypothetical protein CBF23_000445 [Marinomonas agarivorans]|nr:hypothetical protein CBF23_000445 [Marinomonas agarivorans]
MKKTMLSAIIISSLSANSAYSEVKFYGDMEVNSTSIATATEETTYDQNGRFRLYAVAKHTSGDNYALSQAQLLMHTDGDISPYGDAFVQIGNQTWDIQAGRFQGVKVFDLGNDSGLRNVSNIKVYQVDEARGRITDSGGQIALHYKPTKSLNFELGTVFGDAFLDGETVNGDNTTAISAVRPAVVLTTDAGIFSAGFEDVEYQLDSGAKVKHTGYGASAKLVIPNGFVRLSGAFLDDESGEREVVTYAANLQYERYNIGVLNSKVDNIDSTTDPSLKTLYVAYVMPVLDIKGTFVAFGSSYSEAKEVADDKKFTSNIRINHYF